LSGPEREKIANVFDSQHEFVARKLPQAAYTRWGGAGCVTNYVLF